MTGFMIGQYNTALSKQISIPKVKAYAKARGMTVNDVMHAIVSVSLKQFFQHLGDYETNQVKFVVSFTFKQPTALVKDYTYNNDVQDCYYTMQLKPTFEEALQQEHETMTKLKTSITPLVHYYVEKCFMRLFPEFILAQYQYGH